ncbi:MAG TPA: sugar phosphate nucleotidyltransferase [Polyangia bacterium]
MAGGGGTRLWPASRRKRAKQFLSLGGSGGESLLGATVRRLGPVAPLARTFVVAAGSQVGDVLQAVPGLPRENVIAEPVGRNTAPCIGLAAEAIAARDPDAVLAVLPADHHIGDEPAFQAAVAAALELAAREDRIVTVGVRPSRPETGYGYIRTSPAPVAGPAFEAEAFVEKPDGVTARRYLESGRYLWNSGMFFFPARRILAEIREHLPDMAGPLDELRAAFTTAGADAAATIQRVFPGLRSISIDYGVMEHAAGILVLPADFGWNDVGSWSALSDINRKDADGNVALGETLVRHAANNVVVSESGQLVALVGVEGFIVVTTPDAVLVCPKDRAQEVREIVAELERRGLARYL